MTESKATDTASSKVRSPSYPFISLKKAVERIEALAENHKRSPARLAQVGVSWGYGPKSSGLLQTVAALKQFGLIDDIGSGQDRKIVASELAWKILHDARPNAKDAAMKEAALKPRLIAEYASHWVPERPSDAHCESELHLDRGFTQDAAKTFLRVFDETVAFANLSGADSLSLDAVSETTVSDNQSSGKGGFLVPAKTLKNMANQNRATFPLPEGVVALELPDRLSKDSYEDLKAWLDVMLRRASRRSVPSSENDKNDPDAG